MNQNNLQKQLRHYYRQVNLRLPCPRQERIRFLATLKCDVTVYMDEQPQCTMKDIEEHFGTATDIADAYAFAENTELFMKKSLRLKILAAVLAICLVVSGSIFHYCVYTAKNLIVTHTKICHTEVEE